MIKNTIIFVIINLIFLNSCSTNQVVEKDDLTSFTCNPKITQINEFVPYKTSEIIKNQAGNDSTIYEKVPSYSLYSFKFPLDTISSGVATFENATNFNGMFLVTKEAFAYKNKVYFVAILDTLPINENLNGDFIITKFNSNNIDTSVSLRVNGYLSKTSLMYYSNMDFCQDIIKRNGNFSYSISYLNTLRYNSIRFGDSTDFGKYTTMDITVLDDKGNIITEPQIKKSVPYNTTTFLISKATRFLSHNIKIKKGELYYFKSRGGFEYLFALIDVKMSMDTNEKSSAKIIFNRIPVTN